MTRAQWFAGLLAAGALLAPLTSFADTGTSSTLQNLERQESRAITQLSAVQNKTPTSPDVLTDIQNIATLQQQIVTLAASLPPLSATVTPGLTSVIVNNNNTQVWETNAVYTLNYSVTAQNGDIYIPKAAGSSVGGNTGVTYSITGANVGAVSSTLTSNALNVGNAYLIRNGKTSSFTLTVTVHSTSSGMYSVSLSNIYFAAKQGGTLSPVAVQNESTYPVYIQGGPAPVASTTAARGTASVAEGYQASIDAIASALAQLRAVIGQ